MGILNSEFDIAVVATQIVIMILGFIFSAIFSGSEVALFSLSGRMDELDSSDSGNKSDIRILRMLEEPRHLLAAILIGNTFSNIVTSVIAAVLTGSIAVHFGFSEIYVFTIEVVVLTFMILILSEITPKIIAINNPLTVSRRWSFFIYVNFILLKPLAKIIANSTELLENKLPKPSSRVTSEDIKTMAEVSEKGGSIKEDEREIIENVIEFGNIIVREIMTSRVNIFAVSVDDSLEEVLELIREKSISRLPLYENDLDNILGVIYAKDLLPYINNGTNNSTINWRNIARETFYIPANKKLDDLLRDFQQEKTHIAIVVDEYGGTEGLVTMDDILEEIVGDISDDSYDEESLYTQFKNGIYLFDAKIDLDDMEEILGVDITTDNDEYETLGGLIYHLTENLPTVGERVTFNGMELTVHSVNNNRIRKVRVKVSDNADLNTK